MPGNGPRAQIRYAGANGTAAPAPAGRPELENRHRESEIPTYLRKNEFHLRAKALRPVAGHPPALFRSIRLESAFSSPEQMLALKPSAAPAQSNRNPPRNDPIFDFLRKIRPRLVFSRHAKMPGTNIWVPLSFGVPLALSSRPSPSSFPSPRHAGAGTERNHTHTTGIGRKQKVRGNAEQSPGNRR